MGEDPDDSFRRRHSVNVAAVANRFVDGIRFEFEFLLLPCCLTLLLLLQRLLIIPNALLRLRAGVASRRDRERSVFNGLMIDYAEE